MNTAEQLGRGTQTVYIPNSYYFVEYPEDIKMYGISFNTMIGKTALQGEISRKADHPIQIDDQVLLAATLGAESQLGRFFDPIGDPELESSEVGDQKMSLSISLQLLRFWVSNLVQII